MVFIKPTLIASLTEYCATWVVPDCHISDTGVTS